jgi:hypothetical protein
MKVRKITICGGGNGAQTLVPIAVKNLGCKVDIYAPFGDEANQLQAGVDDHGGIAVTGAVQVKAKPHRISNNPAEVIPGSDVVVLVIPAFAHESTLRQITPFLDIGASVGAIPSRGGFGYCASQVLREGERNDVVLFGVQTLPWACRIREYGEVVHVLGVKKVVDAATKPASKIEQIAPLLERMLGLSVDTSASLLALTLANTGQLIHPGIMFGLFAGWDGVPLSASEVPFFYHGISEEGAKMLGDLSDEIQLIRARLEPALDLSTVRTLKTWLLRSYGDAISDPSSLWRAFTSNRAYDGLKAPMREVGPGQFVPDFQARYLTEDVPFGLVVSRAIADLKGVETPTIDKVIAWAGDRLGKDYLGQNFKESRVPQKYGLNNIEALIAFEMDA